MKMIEFLALNFSVLFGLTLSYVIFLRALHRKRARLNPGLEPIRC